MKVEVNIPELDVLIKTIRNLQERINDLEENQAPKEFFNNKQAADYIGVSVDAWKARVLKYGIPKIHNEGTPLYRKEAIDNYLLKLNPSMNMGENVKYKKVG